MVVFVKVEVVIFGIFIIVFFFIFIVDVVKRLWYYFFLVELRGNFKIVYDIIFFIS